MPAWSEIGFGVWCGGSLAWWTVALIRIVRFERLLRFTRAAPAELQRRVGELAELMGLPRQPVVICVSGAVSPLLRARGRTPRRLVPPDLWPRFNERQRDSLLVHELAPLLRGDHLVRHLELVMLGLYWWHPVAWWARSEMQDAEERCCDGVCRPVGARR